MDERHRWYAHGLGSLKKDRTCGSSLKLNALSLVSDFLFEDHFLFSPHTKGSINCGDKGTGGVERSSSDKRDTEKKIVRKKKPGKKNLKKSDFL